MYFERFFAVSAIALILFGVSAAGQSQDRDRPTRLTSREISGTFDQDDRRTLFFSFRAGPGELVLTLDTEATTEKVESAATVRLELYDPLDHRLADVSSQSGTNGASKPKVERIKLSAQMPFVMRLTFSGASGRYSVKLGGDVVLTPVIRP